MKKKISLLWTIIVVVFMAPSCGGNGVMSNYTNGTIVGYINCKDKGLFIVTEGEDSLLSFNVTSSSVGVDLSLLRDGVHDYSTYIGDPNIRFNYRMAVEEEIRKKQEYLCPQNDMWPGHTFGDLENYKQIVITDVNIPNITLENKRG